MTKITNTFVLDPSISPPGIHLKDRSIYIYIHIWNDVLKWQIIKNSPSIHLKETSEIYPQWHIPPMVDAAENNEETMYYWSGKIQGSLKK